MYNPAEEEHIMHTTRIRMLMDVGLSDLEARIYIVLLSESGLSGYRIAKTLGKTIPNVYRALHSLRSKGAVVLDDSSGTELYSAITLASFLKRQKVNLESRILAVEESFKDLDELPGDDGIYRLDNIEQVIMKASDMLDSSGSQVVVIADPLPLGMIQSHLSDAAERGVGVMVRSYFPVTIAGCDVFTWLRRTKRQPWPGQWLSIVADGSQLITAFIAGEDRITNALWTNNRYLSLLLHHGMSSDIIHGRALTMVREGVSPDRVVEEILRLTEKHVFTIPHESLYNLMKDSFETGS